MKLVLLFIACIQSTLLVADVIVFYGNATDVDTGEPIYQERHTLTLTEDGQPESEIVTYIDVSGELLGEKTLTYGTINAPDYVAEFFHVDRMETVIHQGDIIDVEVRKKVTLERPDAAYAIDGGFHYFVQQNLSTLLEGESVIFDFLSAGRGMFITLKITPAQPQDGRIRLKLGLNNFFLSKIVQAVELTYDTETKQLLTYSGLTNMPGPDGKFINATISYDYDT